MAMTTTELTEKINMVINLALASGIPYATIATALNSQSTALTAAAPHHGRLIEEPGPALNPSQP
jgi:hypothetical protein